MNIGIVGSRIFSNFELFNLGNIVSGGAYGTDKLAEIYSKKYNYNIIIHLPEWDKYGKLAGYR